MNAKIVFILVQIRIVLNVKMKHIYIHLFAIVIVFYLDYTQILKIMNVRVILFRIKAYFNKYNNLINFLLKKSKLSYWLL